MTWRSRIQEVLGPSLIARAPRGYEETDRQRLRRRTVLTITLVTGTVLLGFSLSIRPGDSTFYALTGAVAVVWTIGGLASGPLHLGYIRVRGGRRRPVVIPLVTGLAAAGVFVAGALAVREIQPLRDYVESVLAHAQQGSTALIVVVTLGNAIGEEIFFRGAFFAAIGRRYPVVISTTVYGIVTLATGNPMLVLAALTLGLVFGLQRRASGGILAPTITHVVWSMIMLFALPPLFAR
jgi:membrane protease YdiL (CAAX protease family)